MRFRFLSHNNRRRRLRQYAPALLFLAAFPGLVFAQGPENPGDRPAAAADPQAIVPDVRGIGLLAEPRFIGKGIDLANATFGDGTGDRKNGFYVDFSNMITGSGLISAGPGYRHTVFGGKAFFDTSAAASWHFYKMAQGRFEFPKLAGDHLTIGTQARWQGASQVSYFGLGGDRVLEDQSQYQLKTTDVVGYAEVRPSQWFTIGGEFGWLKSPQVSAAAGTFNPNYPDARVMYPTDPGINAASQPDFMHGELSLTADTRDYKSHPTGGGLYRAALTTFSDRNAGTNTFNQYEAEAAQFVPLGTKRLILAMHAWTVFSDVLAGKQVPFYLMPYIGGN